MNEQQRRQRRSLKAKLELLEQDFRKGRCSEAELQTARSAYENFRESTQDFKKPSDGSVVIRQVLGEKPSAPIVSGKGEEIGGTQMVSRQNLGGVTKVFTLPDDYGIAEPLQKIKDSIEEIDQEKARLSNSLKTFPPAQNAGEITSRILELREEWRRVKDTEVYLLEHGKLPEDDVPAIPEGWTEKLTRDKFELNKQIKNLKINLESPSKWQRSLQRAKTPSKKHEVQTKINQGMLELAAMEALFNSL